MMEQLVKRRLIIGLAVLLVLSMGLITLYQLPRREIPVIQHPIATVDTLYPGASAGQVETYITDRLEASFTEIPGIKEVTSVSQAGFSQITITVEDNKNQEQVWNKVQQKINRIKTEFPDGAGTPSLHTDLQMQGVAIYQLVAEQEEELLFLEDWIDSWETAFRQVPGVVRVEIQGLSQRELRLRADPQNRFGSVSGPIDHHYTERNPSGPAGTMESGGKDLPPAFSRPGSGPAAANTAGD